MNTALAMAQPPPMTVAQEINRNWQLYAHYLNSGFTDHIEVPTALKNVIGDQGIAIIATRFSNMIAAPVTTVEDVARGVTQITPSRYLLGHNSIIPGAKKPSSKGLKEDKVARPPNAFILYRQHHHPLVKSAHPKLHNNQISVILGTQWKNEAESTKARYINLAQKLKVKHFLEHPDYQYQPRKPSEKKRRMTRRKAAALAESEQVKSSSSASTTSASVESSSSANQSDTVIPDLAKTLGGNVVLELGDETMDDEAFAAMLEKYNESIPAANIPTTHIARQIEPTAVLYDEPSEATQNDANFYSSVFDYNPFGGNEELTEEMQEMIAALSPQAQQAAFDQQNGSLFDAELARNDEFKKWCTAFDD